MTKIDKSWDYERSVSGVWSRIKREQTLNGYYLHGTVFTPQGIVDVWSDAKYAGLEIVVNGRVYTKQFRQGKTARGLAIAAGKLARAVESHINDKDS